MATSSVVSFTSSLILTRTVSSASPPSIKTFPVIPNRFLRELRKTSINPIFSSISKLTWPVSRTSFPCSSILSFISTTTFSFSATSSSSSILSASFTIVKFSAALGTSIIVLFSETFTTFTHLTGLPTTAPYCKVVVSITFRFFSSDSVFDPLSLLYVVVANASFLYIIEMSSTSLILTPSDTKSISRL